MANKLYTKEQVKKVWKAGQEYWKTSGASVTLEELLEQEKSIELPSDEEIDAHAHKVHAMKLIYVIWNPLYERVVCVHSSEDIECLHCTEEREKVKDTAYSLEGKWFEIDSDNKLCYCGNPVDTSDSDCVKYNLCKEHAMSEK